MSMRFIGSLLVVLGLASWLLASPPKKDAKDPTEPATWSDLPPKSYPMPPHRKLADAVAQKRLEDRLLPEREKAMQSLLGKEFAGTVKIKKVLTDKGTGTRLVIAEAMPDSDQQSLPSTFRSWKLDRVAEWRVEQSSPDDIHEGQKIKISAKIEGFEARDFIDLSPPVVMTEKSSFGPSPPPRIVAGLHEDGAKFFLKVGSVQIQQ